MQNEPQLSADLEKRFNEWRENGMSYDSPEECVFGWNEKRLKHFIATALEEQKQGYIKAIIELDEERKKTPFGYLTEEILAILNGKEA